MSLIQVQRSSLCPRDQPGERPSRAAGSRGQREVGRKPTRRAPKDRWQPATANAGAGEIHSSANGTYDTLRRQQDDETGEPPTTAIEIQVHKARSITHKERIQRTGPTLAGMGGLSSPRGADYLADLAASFSSGTRRQRQQTTTGGMERVLAPVSSSINWVGGDEDANRPGTAPRTRTRGRRLRRLIPRTGSVTGWADAGSGDDQSIRAVEAALRSQHGIRWRAAA